MDNNKITERDWYGAHWKSLRNNLLKLCVRHSDVFLENLGSDVANIERAAEGFFNHIMTQISRWIPDDRMGLWQNTLPLFSNWGRFAEWVKRDIEALRGLKNRKGKVILPKQALGQLLWQYFELARRELEASDRGVSVARVKTWERLDRISRSLASELPAADRRCADEHFLELSNYIREHHKKDRNLPRKVSTIREYFHEFSDSCLRFGITEGVHMESSGYEPDLSFISTSQEGDISTALQALDDIDRSCLDIEFGTKLSSVSYIDKQSFLIANKMSEQAYQELLDNVLERARPLVELLAMKEFQERIDE